jgi:putative DNA primase/helicase
MVEIVRMQPVGPVILRPLTDYAMEPMRWLWPHYLAKGKLHALAGVPGTGKSTITFKIAATFSTGGTWPDGTTAPLGDVAIWSGEDNIEDTIKPRLVAAGADCNRVHVLHTTREDLGPRPFDPAVDMALLGASVSALPELSLLILDPVTAAILGDSHKAAEVRAGLQPIVELCERLDIAALRVSHFAKNSSGRQPVPAQNPGMLR